MAENIGDAIKRSLTESFENLDPLALMYKITSDKNLDDEDMSEVRAKMQGIMHIYEEMTASDKEKFVTQVREMLASRLAMKLKDTNINMDGLQEAVSQAIMQQLILVGIGVLIFIILLVFFGYKLYKSIKEKELRREEKKKAKQMKKKK